MKKRILSCLVAIATILQIGFVLPVSAETTRNPNLILNIDGISSRAVNWAENFGADLTAEEVEASATDYVQNFLLKDNQIGRVMYMVSWRLSCVDSDVFDSFYYKIDRDENGNIIKDENGAVQKSVNPYYSDTTHDGFATGGYPDAEHMYAAEFIKNGIDVYGDVIDATKAAGAEAWLSVRMNDHHHNHIEQFNNYVGNQPEYCTTNERNNYALDFTQEAVQNYYKDYIVELCTNYDIDGIELDWLRSPGVMPEITEENIQIINDYMKDIRAAVNEVNETQNKTIEIATRTYATLERSAEVGFDAAQWIADGSIDVLTVMNWWVPTNYDIPLEAWREEIDSKNTANNEYALIAGSDHQVGNGDIMIRLDPAYLKGFASSAYKRGADGVYLFNYSNKNDAYCLDVSADGSCLRTDKMVEKMNAISDLETAEKGLRKYPYTGIDDTQYDSLYPITLAPGQSASFDIYTASAPELGTYKVMVGVDSEESSLSVVVNDGATIQKEDAPECTTIADGYQYTGSNTFAWHIGAMAERVMSFKATDLSKVSDGYNTITITNNGDAAQDIMWLEIWADNSEEVPYTLEELSYVTLKDADGNDLPSGQIKSVRVAQVGAKTYAYAGHENAGIYVYDITDATAPVCIQTIAIANTFKYGNKLEYMKYGNDQYIIYATGQSANRNMAKIKADGTLDTDNAISVYYNNGWASEIKVVDNYIITSGNDEICAKKFNGTGFTFSNLVSFKNYDDLHADEIYGFDARMVDDELYMFVTKVEKATSADSWKYVHHLYKGDPDAGNLTRIDSEISLNQQQSMNVSFMDDTSVICAVESTPNTNGVGIIRIDFTDEGMTQTAIPTENSGKAGVNLSDRYVVQGGQSDVYGELILYGKNQGIVQKVGRATYRGIPTNMTTMNGKIYVSTTWNQLLVFQYGDSKVPPYDTVRGYALKKLGTADIAAASLAGTEYTAYTEPKSLAVYETGNKTFAYVGKQNISGQIPGGIYVYDITDLSNPKQIQYLSKINVDGGEADLSNVYLTQHKLDLFEYGDDAYIMLTTNNNAYSNKAFAKINADGTLSTDSSKLQYIYTKYYSGVKALGNYAFVAGQYNVEGVNKEYITLREYNGEKFTDHESILVTDETMAATELMAFDAMKSGNEMLVMLGKYCKDASNTASFYFELYEADLTAAKISFEKVYSTTVSTGEIRSISFVDENTAVASLNDKTVRIDVTASGLEVTQIANGQGRSTVSVAYGYAAYGIPGGTVYLYNADNGVISSAESGTQNQLAIHKNRLYTLENDGKISAYSYTIDVSVDEYMTAASEITGVIDGYEAGDVLKLSIGGNDYTPEISEDGSFSQAVSGLTAGDTVEGIATLIRNDGIIVLKEISAQYLGSEDITINVKRVYNSTGEQADFVNGAMSADVTIVSLKAGAKTAVLAVYEGGKLVDVETKPISKNVENLTFNFTVADAANTTAKVMLLDSLSGMAPECEAKELFDANF